MGKLGQLLLAQRLGRVFDPSSPHCTSSHLAAVTSLDDCYQPQDYSGLENNSDTKRFKWSHTSS